MSSFSHDYLEETKNILNILDTNNIESLADHLLTIRLNKGRLFILGVGGSAGTATHAVNDFRKICHIESYCTTDNVCELTARVNDDGWDSCFSSWLSIANLNKKDAILIFSVGGGNSEKNISVNIVKAIDLAKKNGTTVLGIVGKDGGYTKQHANACVVIPPIVNERITPHTEGLAGVILHLVVSHPKLKIEQTKWESTK